MEQQQGLVLYQEGNQCKEHCWEPTSICKCYGGGTTTIYQDTNNSTDLDFSSNTTTIKWNSSGGDASDVFTQAVRNCILGGNVAQLSLTTFDNIVYLFNADAILSDAGASGIGSYVFTGTTDVGGSGKIMHAELICGSGETGTVCLFTNCNDEQEWRDVTTPDVDNGTPYTIINPDSLIDCPTECTLTETIELISCAAETTSEANIGDYVLTIATVCVDTRIVLGQSMYNISNSNSPILEPLLTDSCDPTPQIQEIQNCIKDINGVKWTQIAIVLTTVPPTVVSTLYYNQSTLVLGTPSGDSTKWTPCECNLTPECCHCFCAMTVPIKVRTEKELVAAKKAEASTTKPVKVTICSTNWRDCDLKVVKTTYTIDGKDVPAETFAKLKYTKTVCTDPIPTYTPGTPTCATYNDPVYGTIVLNVTIFTNDINPVDTFTIYNLADNYPGLGNIGDVYLPADELLVTACNCSPLPECITTTEECYEALSDVKGVANQGETITVKITHNAVTNTDFYEITHSATSTLIYAGPDPVGDIGLDVGNTAIWVLASCTPELPEVFDILEKEVCGTIDGSTDNYELIRVYTRNPLTGVLSVIHYEDNFGNVVSGVIAETCCTCNTLCEVTPSLLPVNMRCDSYSRSNNVNNNLQNQGGWLSGYNNTIYFDKWSNTATYDLLMNDLGQTGLVGAPRNLQYQISGEINGNTFSGTVTIPVPTAGTPLSLANQINAIVGANVLDYDGYGWSFQYNSAWTSYSLLIGEFADNHAGGFQDISFGWKWAVRLNGGVLEDGIGVDPNNLNNGNWFSAVNCVSI